MVNVMSRFSPVLVNGDEHGADMGRMGVSGFPTVVFCDLAGKPVAKVEGYVDAQTFRRRASEAAELARAPE